jgi:hypothetical protein
MFTRVAFLHFPKNFRENFSKQIFTNTKEIFRKIERENFRFNPTYDPTSMARYENMFFFCW